MKKNICVSFFVFMAGFMFATGSMDASMISEDHIVEMENIVESLNPEVAIQAALESYPNNNYPMYYFLNAQEMRINRIFNEYGVEFSEYSTYNGLSSKAQIVFAKLKSRYSFLHKLSLNSSNELLASLELLRE